MSAEIPIEIYRPPTAAQVLSNVIKFDQRELESFRRSLAKDPDNGPLRQIVREAEARLKIRREILQREGQRISP
jgi:hypothetical protein